MEQITFNKDYLIKGNTPWFPIMGEFHYTRYPKRYWRESLYKMKAGGVDVVSTYVFWIHHEEKEGEYDFTENRNLHEFVALIKECGLTLMLRIGPWCHGECRNGGFPDWLMTKDFIPRTNDERYFSYVQQFYQMIYEQVKGYFYQEKGPIIGIQIENEFGHCGGLTGDEGEAHMKRLYQMAKAIGFEVPLYTATGWGGAVTGGLLPVMGGYCEAPWDERVTEIEPSGNYIFTNERNDHNIGSDYGFGTGVTFDLTRFPFLTAELGGGLQVTKHRRPIATGTDIGAMSLVKLGCGVNLLGYYMYHGGTNPVGRYSSLQESKATGYPNDYPELSYDFNAPIKEYGQISDSFKEIKLYAMFIKDFGDEFCQMQLKLPKDNPLKPSDFTSLRTSIRHKNASGYLFVNNYQRHYPMKEHQEVCLQVDLDSKRITFSPLTIPDRFYAFYPFEMPIGSATLHTALATPLCKLMNEEMTYVFYTDSDPCYEITGELGDTKLLTITREQAKNSYKITLTKEHLIISDSLILKEKHGLCCIGRSNPQFMIYPELDADVRGFERTGMTGDFSVYEQGKSMTSPIVSFKQLEVKEDLNPEHKVRYEIILEGEVNAYNDLFLKIAYEGESAKLYVNHQVIADHFYTGQIWEVGCKRFDFPKKFVLEITPLIEGSKIYLEQWPKMKAHKACELLSVDAEYEFLTPIMIGSKK